MADPRTDAYWVGSLAMTVAVAVGEPKPHPILKSAIREFLASRPPGNELGDMLREALRVNGGRL